MRARGGGPSPRVDGVEAYPDSRSSSMASTRTGVRRLVCYRPLASSRFWIWSQRERALALLAKLHCSQTYFGSVLGVGSIRLSTHRTGAIKKHKPYKPYSCKAADEPHR